MTKNYSAHVVFLLFLSSCSKEGDYINDTKVFASSEITTKNVSYQNYIKPLLTKNCATCHGVYGSAETWWLNSHSYENTLGFANPITTTIINGTMPPPPRFPFSQRDRDLVAAWIAKGMPEY